MIIFCCFLAIFRQTGHNFSGTPCTQISNFIWFCPVCYKSNSDAVQTPTDIHTSPGQPDLIFDDSNIEPASSANLNSPLKFKLPRKGFNSFHLNVRSLFPKIDEVRQFAKDNPFHVLAFSESWLTGNISNSEISITGYSDPIRCDRKYTEHPGRVLLYI